MVESTRNCWLMARIDPKKKEELKIEAEKRGQTLTEFTLNAIEWYRLRNTNESH
jgi:uncharacterized protein (DUF1778 family)